MSDLTGEFPAAVLLAAGLLALPCRGGWIFDGRPSHWEGFPGELQPAEESYPVLGPQP